MDDPEFKPAAIIRVEMIEATCPCCGSTYEFSELEIAEGDDGAFQVAETARYVRCDDCDECFDAGAIVFDPREEHTPRIRMGKPKARPSIDLPTD